MPDIASGLLLQEEKASNQPLMVANQPHRRFTFTRRRPNRRKTSDKALKHFKEEIRRMTGRTRGATLMKVIKDLKSYLTGWKLYFGFSE